MNLKFIIFGLLARTNRGYNIVNNNLDLSAGASVFLGPDELAVTNNNYNDPNVMISIKDIKQGRFENINNLGYDISQFLQKDITESNIRFIHDGTDVAPEYSVCIPNLCQVANISFYGVLPTIANNEIEVSQGRPVRLTNDEISLFISFGYANNALIKVNDLKHGIFEYRADNNVFSVTSFRHSDVLSGKIWFVPDGSDNAPSYSLSIGNGKYFNSPQKAKVTFNSAPKIEINPFIVDQDSATPVTIKDINAFDRESLDFQMALIVESFDSGHFAYESNIEQKLSFFTLTALQRGVIRLVHNGSEVPQFNLSANDGALSSSIVSSNLTLNRKPVITGKLKNHFVDQYKEFAVSFDKNLFQDPDGDDLVFSVKQAGGTELRESGIFYDSNQTLSGTLYSTRPLNIAVTATDERGLTATDTFEINVNAAEAIDALALNRLTIGQGQTKTLTKNDLLARAEDKQDVIFEVSDVIAGKFYKSGFELNPVRFLQSELEFNQISFKHDNSRTAPSYTVEANSKKGKKSKVEVKFNTRPELLISRNITLDQGSATRLTPLDFNAQDTDSSSVDLIFKVNKVKSGIFKYKDSIASISFFTQLSLMQGVVEFVQDGSSNIPSFEIKAEDQGLETGWKSTEFLLNLKPVTQGVYKDQMVTVGKEFSINIDPGKFKDPDDSEIVISAGLSGGRPLPKGIIFNKKTGVLSGIVNEPKQIIEITATDPRGVSVSSSFILESEKSIVDELKVLWETLGAFFGTLLSFGLMLYIRRNSLQHREEHRLAYFLRKRLDLSYWDFGHFSGDTFRSKIEKLEAHLNNPNQEIGIRPGFLSTLSRNDFNCFIGLLSQELKKQNLFIVKSAGRLNRFLNALMFCHCRTSLSDIDFDMLEGKIITVGDSALKLWQKMSLDERQDYYFEDRRDCDERLLSFCKRKSQEEDDQDEESMGIGVDVVPSSAFSIRSKLNDLQKDLKELTERVEQLRVEP